MPETTTFAIAPATPADVPMLSQTLAQAFHNDPVFEWMVPNPAYRTERLRGVFTAFAQAFVPHNETYMAGDGAGAAMWAPAGVEPIPADQLESFAQRLGVVLQEDIERAWQAQALLDEHHPAQPCFYLQFVGVTLEHRGLGLGGRLLTTVLDRCDATGTPAYLEATSVDNRRLYQRHGFATTGKLTLPQGPPLWTMWREPTA